MAALPKPLAVYGQVTFDPATKSLLVKASGVCGMYWRRGHAALLKAEESGRYWDAVADVRANVGVRGEPLPDGWLRFKVSDADYRELAGPGLSAIVTVDTEAPRILGVLFRRRQS